MTDELREKCARAICRADDIDPNARYVHGGPMWKQRLGHADAILSIAIPAIREECAGVVERVITEQERLSQNSDDDIRVHAMRLALCDQAKKSAAAIRALGEKQG